MFFNSDRNAEIFLDEPRETRIKSGETNFETTTGAPAHSLFNVLLIFAKWTLFIIFISTKLASDV